MILNHCPLTPSQLLPEPSTRSERPTPPRHLSGTGRVPPLKVVTATNQTGSKVDGLLSINLLIFEVLRFAAREVGAASADQTSLPPLVRRGGGPASLLSLCILYQAIATAIGVPLDLLLLDPPPMLPARGPQSLLRYTPEASANSAENSPSAELYIDLLAAGRLRGEYRRDK